MAAGPVLLSGPIEEKRQLVRELVRAHKGRSVAVIGSIARGEATIDSGVDLLVELEPSSSLLDLIRLEEALQDLLGTHVDVISAGALLRA
jgi:uncharacterized protein